MDASSIGLFTLAERRLSWLDRRQELLSQNVANADTPGWRSRDLGAFADALNDAGPARTQPNHLAGTLSAAAAQNVAEQKAGRGLDGNAVSVEEQLMKVAETESSQELATNIYTKYLGFFRLALGRAQ